MPHLLTYLFPLSRWVRTGRNSTHVQYFLRPFLARLAHRSPCDARSPFYTPLLMLSLGLASFSFNLPAQSACAGLEPLIGFLQLKVASRMALSQIWRRFACGFCPVVDLKQVCVLPRFSLRRQRILRARSRAEACSPHSRPSLRFRRCRPWLSRPALACLRPSPASTMMQTTRAASAPSKWWAQR